MDVKKREELIDRSFNALSKRLKKGRTSFLIAIYRYDGGDNMKSIISGRVGGVEEGATVATVLSEALHGLLQSFTRARKTTQKETADDKSK